MRPRHSSSDHRSGNVGSLLWDLSTSDAAAGTLYRVPDGARRFGALALYGETVGIDVNGRRGSQIYIVNTTQGIKDDLLRDTIVYLTCLHESGHALGLEHTNQFADIMFYFGYGGDIVAYFRRYRQLLAARSDIPLHSGTSEADRSRVRALLN